MTIHLTIPGDPTPKARARTYTMPNGRVGSYTPTKTAAAEEAIRMAWVAAKGQGFERDVPLKMSIAVYRRRPKSAPKKRVYPTTKPDWDNYAKLICDALEGFAYENDSQIVDSYCSKRYSDNPRVVVEIEEMGAR